jgi:hypothetical protein
MCTTRLTDSGRHLFLFFGYHLNAVLVVSFPSAPANNDAALGQGELVHDSLVL